MAELMPIFPGTVLFVEGGDAPGAFGLVGEFGFGEPAGKGPS